MDKIQRGIQTFDEEDAVSIREAKVATSSSTVVSDLAYVKRYFGNLPGVIVSLEARDLPLIESVKIMDTIQEGVKQTPGPVDSSDTIKLEQVLQRNPGWRTMVAVSDILGGQSTPLQEINARIPKTNKTRTLKLGVRAKLLNSPKKNKLKSSSVSSLKLSIAPPGRVFKDDIQGGNITPVPRFTLYPFYYNQVSKEVLLHHHVTKKSDDHGVLAVRSTTTMARTSCLEYLSILKSS
uniref:Uncharacterized protein n=1 Tax=Timema poppense TaxID=170557 RepID=A0A7R9HC38_TIMPO|nr:unnamed protein product [Timema poppensis]